MEEYHEKGPRFPCSQAASFAAQQAAASQLGQFNGQIKSKDDVTVQHQLVAPGQQQQPKSQNSLTAKAKADGEDVMTPLLTQAAPNVLTEATKKHPVLRKINGAGVLRP